MFSGIGDLRRAAALLPGAGEAGQAVPPRDVLAEAFRHVWAATTYWDSWPTEMRERAEGLYGLFSRTGPIDVAAGLMTDEQARSAAADIRRFVRDAERLAGPHF